MKKYVSLPKNVLWELVDPSEVDNDTITIKEKDISVTVKKRQYTEAEYERILSEASEYCISNEQTLETSETTEHYRKELPLSPDGIVVKEGSFWGVLLICTSELEAYLHYDSCAYKEYTGIIFTDGSSIGTVSDEQSRCPGCWRLTTRYFLKKIST